MPSSRGDTIVRGHLDGLKKIIREVHASNTDLHPDYPRKIFTDDEALLNATTASGSKVSSSTTMDNAFLDDPLGDSLKSSVLDAVYGEKDSTTAKNKIAVQPLGAQYNLISSKDTAEESSTDEENKEELRKYGGNMKYTDDTREYDDCVAQEDNLEDDILASDELTLKRIAEMKRGAPLLAMNLTGSASDIELRQQPRVYLFRINEEEDRILWEAWNGAEAVISQPYSKKVSGSIDLCDISDVDASLPDVAASGAEYFTLILHRNDGQDSIKLICSTVVDLFTWFEGLSYLVEAVKFSMDDLSYTKKVTAKTDKPSVTVKKDSDYDDIFRKHPDIFSSLGGSSNVISNSTPIGRSTSKTASSISNTLKNMQAELRLDDVDLEELGVSEADLGVDSVHLGMDEASYFQEESNRLTQELIRENENMRKEIEKKRELLKLYSDEEDRLGNIAATSAAGKFLKKVTDSGASSSDEEADDQTRALAEEKKLIDDAAKLESGELSDEDLSLLLESVDPDLLARLLKKDSDDFERYEHDDAADLEKLLQESKELFGEEEEDPFAHTYMKEPTEDELSKSDFLRNYVYAEHIPGRYSFKPRSELSSAGGIADDVQESRLRLPPNCELESGTQGEVSNIISGLADMNMKRTAARATLEQAKEDFEMQKAVVRDLAAQAPNFMSR